MSYDRTNISEFARELGITAIQLYKWRKELEEFGKGTPADNLEELGTANIKGAKIKFNPSKRMKAKLKNLVFKRVR